MPELRFDIVGDNRSGVRALNEVETAGQRAGRGLESAGKGADSSRGKLGKLTGQVGTLAKAYGPLAAAAAGGAVLKFGIDSIKAASDTQQAFGAIDSVFGKNNATVKGWANNAATQVGLARSEYGNLAVVLGSMLKNTGIEDYSTKTNDLIKLGADLAATYGGSVNDAVGAVGALIRGETDPIEAYGVSINQAKVEALLASQGLGKLTGSARTQAEQQARLTLLTQQTTAAQGAFGRETDTLGGQQQRLSAKFTNLKDTLGQKLLPVATQVVSWLSNTVSGTNKTAGVLQALGKLAQTYVTPIIAGFRSALQTVSTALAGASGKGGSTATTLQNIAKVAGPLASLMGKTLGTSIRTAGVALGAIITVAGKVSAAIGAIRSAVDSAISALGRLKDKASINIPNPLGGLGGLFRAEGGLVRASGGLLAGGASAAQVSFTSSPTVMVNVDSRQLRGFVRVMIQDEISDLFGAVQAGVTN